MSKISRLEKTLYRLEAQHACLGWAFEQIAERPGPIFELGLGLGRSFNHMVHKLGPRARDIVVFEREVRCYPDCRPDDEQLVVGNLEDTLPQQAAKHAKKVVLAHSDVGSMDKSHNAYMSKLVSENLKPALAPGAIVMSDLPLDIAGCVPQALPGNARVDRYYLYINT